MRYERLCVSEREEIGIGLARNESQRAIARRLGRSPSTISREVRRFRHKWHHYRPIYCQEAATKQASSRKLHKRKLLLNKDLRDEVHRLLKRYWSPKQIEQYLKATYNSAMQVSKESIYTYLYVFMRRNMREEFIEYLRRQQKTRHKRTRGSAVDPKQSSVLGKIELIDERPSEANDRLIPGHWEGDIMIGNGNKQTALGTLVERTTRYAILVPLKNKTAEEVRTQFAKAINTLPQALKRSLTYDQGSEMAQHRLFTEETEMKVFFCHPRSPWERGTNENTNGLIRQFFPKNTNFNEVPEEQIKRAEQLLNERPRQTLGWKTPAEKMQELLR